MSETYKLSVRTFRMGTDKEAALKPLEEASEVRESWQVIAAFDKFYREADWFGLADEIADCIQACCNLAARYDIDLAAAMGRCEERNRERGRYE